MSQEDCPKLVDFLQNKEITFASVDIRQDRIMLGHVNIIIPEQFHIDIQDLFKSEDRFEYTPPYDKDGMGSLAATIIDRARGKLKNDFPCNGHHY